MRSTFPPVLGRVLERTFLVYFTTVEGHGKLCTKRRSEFLVLIKSMDPFNFICTSDSRTLIVLTQPVGFQILI